jgi:hypothetical protein
MPYLSVMYDSTTACFTRFKVHVHGVDLSTNMVAIAQDYRVDMEPQVKHR